MIEVLTVCTGNVCRSPLAEALLRERLAPLDIRVRSAGTRALIGSAMTPEAQRLATDNGVQDAESHRARLLTEGLLESPDLIFAMSREHRRHIVDLAPRRLRATFTLREFARLAAYASDASIADAVAGASDAHDAVRLTAGHIAAMRGEAEPPTDASDDDIVDPYRRSWQTYELSAAQLVPAVDEVVRVLRAALA